jgi:two-component system response regulator HupR/HoxA
MSQRPRVLVVDDEELNRDIVKRVFGSSSEMVEAAHGAAARELLEGRTIDVIISDHAMPHLNGAELSRLVHARWPETVLILITGYDDAPEVVAAHADGAIFEILPKPWQIAALRASMGRALAERARRLAGKSA